MSVFGLVSRHQFFGQRSREKFVLAFSKIFFDRLGQVDWVEYR